MHELTLRFESPEIKLGALGNPTVADVTWDGWRIREVYTPDAHSAIRKGIGSYRLLVERNVTLAESAQHWHSLGVDLVDRIDRLWAFAAGLPFRSRGFGLDLVPIAPPPRWTSNIEEVEQAIQRATHGISASLHIESRHWRYSSTFPLATLVVALRSYDTATELVKELVDLHYEGHSTSSLYAQMVLFAKALEIVRELLAGRTDSERQAALPIEVQKALTRPLSWLYALSNTRRETRHAITKALGPTLHPQMVNMEQLDYLRNADLTIRSVVCEQLGIQPAIILEGKPPEGTTTP